MHGVIHLLVLIFTQNLTGGSHCNVLQKDIYLMQGTTKTTWKYQVAISISCFPPSSI